MLCSLEDEREVAFEMCISSTSQTGKYRKAHLSEEWIILRNNINKQAWSYRYTYKRTQTIWPQIIKTLTNYKSNQRSSLLPTVTANTVKAAT